jgi:ketosteroid isomerase-like protein
MFSKLVWSLAVLVCFGTVRAARTAENDENTIRRIIADAIHRLNQGDLTAIHDFWDEDADYVSIEGQLVRGRPAIEEFFARLLKAGSGTETARSSRFVLSPATSPSWTVLGQ